MMVTTTTMLLLLMMMMVTTTTMMMMMMMMMTMAIRIGSHDDDGDDDDGDGQMMVTTTTMLLLLMVMMMMMMMMLLLLLLLMMVMMMTMAIRIGSEMQQGQRTDAAQEAIQELQRGLRGSRLTVLEVASKHLAPAFAILGRVEDRSAAPLERGGPGGAAEQQTRCLEAAVSSLKDRAAQGPS